MKAAVLTSPFNIEIQEVATPAIKADEVLIETTYCGICGSELHAYNGKHPLRRPPVILGHEASGVVREVGAQVKTIQPGQRVTVFPLLGCGECPDCRRGEENLCDNKLILGSQAWPGPFGQFFSAPESCVVPLPDSISDRAAALIEPLAVGLHAVRSANLAPGGRIAVLGAGAIGLGIIQLAALAGVTTIIATDIQPFNLQKAQELGATHSIVANDPQLLDKVAEICAHEGCDAVFVAAGAPALINQGLTMLRKHGVLMVVAMYDGDIPVDVMGVRAVEKVFTGTKMYLRDDFRRIIDLMAAGKLPAEQLITHELPLSEAAAAFGMYADRVPGIVRILLSNK